MTDYLGEAAAAPDDWDPPPARERTWGHPASLAVLSLVLAFVCIQGVLLFRGLSYTLPFAAEEDLSPSIGDDFDDSADEEPQTPGFVVAGAFLTAAFSLVPLLLGLLGIRRETPDLARWVDPVLRAAVALSLLSLSLRLVQAVIVMTTDEASGFGLFSYLNYV